MDFGRQFSNIAKRAGYNPDAIERQLTHKEKNQVRAAYHRSEYLPERIKMLQWWADSLEAGKTSNRYRRACS